jgi:hypothetical protein
MDSWWSDKQVQVLRVGDVMPLPLMVETNWTTEGWEVNIILVTDVEKSGYNSSLPIWTHLEPYTDLGGSTAEAHRVTDAALLAFGDRLRSVLADPTPPTAE